MGNNWPLCWRSIWYGPKRRKPHQPPLLVGPVELDDVALIEKAKKGRNGEQFAALWAGDTSSYQSQSEADMALCNWLAWWTNKDAAGWIGFSAPPADA